MLCHFEFEILAIHKTLHSLPSVIAPASLIFQAEGKVHVAASRNAALISTKN